MFVEGSEKTEKVTVARNWSILAVLSALICCDRRPKQGRPQRCVCALPAY